MIAVRSYLWIFLSFMQGLLSFIFSMCMFLLSYPCSLKIFLRVLINYYFLGYFLLVVPFKRLSLLFNQWNLLILFFVDLQKTLRGVVIWILIVSYFLDFSCFILTLRFWSSLSQSLKIYQAFLNFLFFLSVLLVCDRQWILFHFDWSILLHRVSVILRFLSNT